MSYNRIILTLAALLLFAVGVIVGQSKRTPFDGYLRPSMIAPMDLALALTNMDILYSHQEVSVPRVYFSSECVCFTANAMIPVSKEPIDQLRMKLEVSARITREAIERQFPNLLVNEHLPPKLFRMSFSRLPPNEKGDFSLAEFADGKLNFK